MMLSYSADVFRAEKDGFGRLQRHTSTSGFQRKAQTARKQNRRDPQPMFAQREIHALIQRLRQAELQISGETASTGEALPPP